MKEYFWSKKDSRKEMGLLKKKGKKEIYKQVRTLREMLYDEKKEKYYSRKGWGCVIMEYIFFALTIPSIYILNNVGYFLANFAIGLGWAFLSLWCFSKEKKEKEYKDNYETYWEDVEVER